jgi:hypothetical protein
VLEGALGLILAKLDEFSSLAAETVRLDGLLTALQAADVDAGGSGTVQGFEQPAAGPAGLWGFLTGLRVASVGANKRKKGPAKSEAGTADSKAAAAAASDADDEEVGEATGLLLHADRPSNRRASGSTEALPAAAGGVGTASQQWGVITGNCSGGVRLSRVLRLMDGAAAGFCAEELSAWVPGRHHMPTCVCSELSFSIAPGELDAQQLSESVQQGIVQRYCCITTAPQDTCVLLQFVLVAADHAVGCAQQHPDAAANNTMPGMQKRQFTCALCAPAGESLLVMGPSGCGKSSLLRVIAGLWTVGSGTVRGPPPQALFFLPQVHCTAGHFCLLACLLAFLLG